MIYDVAVVGGGASGMTAAIFAASQGARTILAEKNDRVGKKLLTTGNGQCNLTNQYAEAESAYHGQDVTFIRGPLCRFGVTQTLDFFERLGILPKTCEGGKIYPNSFQASSVLDVLRLELEREGVEAACGFCCEALTKKGETFYLRGRDGRTLAARCVVVCAGGSAAPQTGTDGKSYALLEGFGHRKTALFPSLVQVRCDKKRVLPMKGVKIDARVSCFVDGVGKKDDFGEVLFTEYGLSGPPVFQLSRIAAKGCGAGKKVEFFLDFFPEWQEEELYSYLSCRNRDVLIEHFLLGMLPKQLGRQIVRQSCSCKMTESAQILSDAAIRRMAQNMKGLSFEITGTNGWDRAQVTAGGIQTADFSPVTLESKLASGLFAAGEILDIDGDCGGYNLQWAWSSGAVSGMNAGKLAKGDGRCKK